MTTMGIGRKVSALMLLLFVASLCNTYFIFALERNGNTRLSWVEHTNDVLLGSQQLLGLLHHAEAGQRGYLLTQDLTYLAPYHRALPQIEITYNDLLAFADNQSQKNRLFAIKEKIDLRLDELAQTVMLAQKQGFSYALERLISHTEKSHMAEIYSRLTEFENQQLLMLEQHKGDYNNSRTQITTLITVELIFFLLLGLFCYMFVRYNVLKPLNKLIFHIKLIERGKRLNPTELLPNDEFSQLSKTLYTMSETVYERSKQLEDKAIYDELTGLKNRVMLADELQSAINNSIAQNNKAALLFLDLNKLKQINDTLGHDAGDELIKETARRLTASVRASDSIYRIGGDEFLIIIKNIHSTADVQQLINALHEQLNQLVQIGGQEMTISLSIGAAMAPDHSTQAEKLIKLADVAMYHAKTNQLTDCCYFNTELLELY